MNGESRDFELPKNIDRYLAALSKLYGQNDNRELQEIIVNARIRVHEEWSRDGWDERSFGHALYLTIPESLYLRVVDRKEDISKKIEKDLNKIQNVRAEFIDVVFIEMEVRHDNDWRKTSGLLLSTGRVVSPNAIKGIWADESFRLFLSHKSEAKAETATLKIRLAQFGISAFVAHEDILPTKEWQDEIENALATMDGFAALMTDKFHDSFWTDQEVGFAVARGVPIIAVNLGRDPYGFIGKFQALRSSWKMAHEDIVKVLINSDQVFRGFVRAIRKCSSWDEGNVLAKALPWINRLSAAQAEELIASYNASRELRGSFGFNGGKPSLYGPGLVAILAHLGFPQYEFSENGIIDS